MPHVCHGALLQIACALCHSRVQGHAFASVWQSHPCSSCVHRVAQRSIAQHSTAQPNTAQHSTAQPSPAQPSPAQPSIAQQPSTSRQDTLKKHSLEQKGIWSQGMFSTPVTVQTGQLAAAAWGLLLHLALQQGQRAWPLEALPQSKTACCAEALIQGQGARC